MKLSSEKNDVFYSFAQNIDHGYPQSMFWTKIRKKVYPCIPQFYYIKMGLKGVFIARTYYPDEFVLLYFILDRNLRISYPKVTEALSTPFNTFRIKMTEKSIMPVCSMTRSLASTHVHNVQSMLN